MAPNLFSYLSAPATCACGAELTRRQRRRWAYRQRAARLAGQPEPPAPSCCRSHALEAKHQRDPQLATRIGKQSYAARKARSRLVRVFETCPYPDGPQRDRYIYKAAYRAGLEAKRRMVRAEARARLAS